MRGSSAKVFEISLKVPSIVTDIKTPKWEGITIKLIKIIKDPLIVLESYICVCVPFWKNILLSSIVLEFSTSIWWGVSLNFLNIPSIVTGNLNSFLYTQTLKIFKLLNIPSLLQEISTSFWEGVIEIFLKYLSNGTGKLVVLLWACF